MAFDLDALAGKADGLEEDATIESADFIIGDAEAGVESDGEIAEQSPRSATAPEGESSEAQDQELTNPTESQGKSLAALQRNREKKRKRRERQKDAGEEVARRRVHFLARATLVKSEEYGVDGARHAKSGYVGVVDRGREFTFLAGPGGRRLRQLLRHQYELLEFDKLP